MTYRTVFLIAALTALTACGPVAYDWRESNRDTVNQGQYLPPTEPVEAPPAEAPAVPGDIVVDRPVMPDPPVVGLPVEPTVPTEPEIDPEPEPEPSCRVVELPAQARPDRIVKCPGDPAVVDPFPGRGRP